MAGWVCGGCGVGDFADAGAGDGTSGWVVSEAVMILKHNTCTTPDLNTGRGWWWNFSQGLQTVSATSRHPCHLVAAVEVA